MALQPAARRFVPRTRGPRIRRRPRLSRAGSSVEGPAAARLRLRSESPRPGGCASRAPRRRDAAAPGERSRCLRSFTVICCVYCGRQAERGGCASRAPGGGTPPLPERSPGLRSFAVGCCVCCGRQAERGGCASRAPRRQRTKDAAAPGALARFTFLCRRSVCLPRPSGGAPGGCASRAPRRRDAAAPGERSPATFVYRWLVCLLRPSGGARRVRVPRTPAAGRRRSRSACPVRSFGVGWCVYRGRQAERGGCASRAPGGGAAAPHMRASSRRDVEIRPAWTSPTIAFHSVPNGPCGLLGNAVATAPCARQRSRARASRWR